MTAPNYPDKDKVMGKTYAELKTMIPGFISHKDLMAITLKLWDARDSARGTAIMQDEVIQKASIVMLKLKALQKLGAALSEFMASGDSCGDPFSETMKRAWVYVCDKGDRREVIGERLGSGWQSLQEIETTIAQVLEGLAGTTEVPK